MSERTAVVAAQRPQDSSAVPPQLKLLLKHFLEYADHDVSYNAPGTPPRAMSFAVLGKFFDDTELASALPAAQQAKLIDSIRPPQGRHVTWRDFIIVLQIVAEYRFSGLDDAERLKAIVADLLTKLDRKVTPSAAVAAETGGPIPSAAPPPLSPPPWNLETLCGPAPPMATIRRTPSIKSAISRRTAVRPLHAEPSRWTNRARWNERSD